MKKNLEGNYGLQDSFIFQIYRRLPVKRES